jgi:DNA repair exonuclease SbcCD ATPase subunit
MLPKKYQWAAVLSVLLASSGFLAGSSPAAETAVPAPERSVLQAELKTVTDEIQSLRSEIDRMNLAKSGLWEQVTGLHLQKHIANLNTYLQKVTAKLQAARQSNDAAKIAQLTGQQATLQSELSWQQDILHLQTRLRAARAGGQNDAVKDLQAQMKAKHEAIRALHPVPAPGGAARPLPAITPPAGVSLPAPGVRPSPVTTPRAMPFPLMKPEDPAIQALIDQIKPLDEQIKQDLAKIEELKVRQAGLQEKLNQ